MTGRRDEGGHAPRGRDDGGHGHGSFEPEPGGRQVPYSHEQPLACPVGEEKGREHFFDDPVHVKWVLRALYAVCGGLFAVDFFFHRHTVHPWEGVWGFYPLYGFVSCVLLVLAAKEMRKVVMRDGDYYDEPRVSDVVPHEASGHAGPGAGDRTEEGPGAGPGSGPGEGGRRDEAGDAGHAGGGRS